MRESIKFYLIRFLYRFVAFYSMAMIFYSGNPQADNSAALKALLIIIPVAVITLVGLKTDHNIKFVGASLISVILMVFISEASYEREINVAISVIVLLLVIFERNYSIYKEMSPVKKPYALIPCLGAYIMAAFFERKLFVGIIYCTTFLCLILFLILKNMDNRNRYFNNKSVKISKNEAGFINHVNKQAMRVFIGVLSFVMVVASIPSYFSMNKAVAADIYNRAIDAIEKFINYLVIPTRGCMGPTDRGAYDNDAAMDLEQKAAGNALQQLEGDKIQILYIIVGVIIVLMIIIFIYFLICTFKNRYQSKSQSIIDSSVIMEEETFIKGHAPSKDEPGLLDFSNNAKIRKAYKKLIKSSGGHIKEAYTPCQAEKAAGLDKDSCIDMVHAIYEKARYSQDGCTKEECKNMLQTIKQR